MFYIIVHIIQKHKWYFIFFCVNFVVKYVTVHTPLSREVFWHIHAKIPRYLFFSMGKKAIQFQVFLFCFLESPYRIIYCNMNLRCFPFLGFI